MSDTSQYYRIIWRWHFFAGLFCIPFILILSITGTIYLFKPQVEAMIDWRENHLDENLPQSLPSQQIQVVMKEQPGEFIAFELSPGISGANRIDLKSNSKIVRCYIDPATLRILKTLAPEQRLMQVVKKIHGELLIGDRGSNLVELAACWTVTMVLSGIYLWWPRNHRGFAGVLYPRVAAKGKIFWRDLHSVLGVWVSLGILILILTGLPWASVWGEYFRWGRQQLGLASQQSDWKTRSSGEHANHPNPKIDSNASLTSETERVIEFSELDRVISVARGLKLESPVIVQPPSRQKSVWVVKSMTQNRPFRTTFSVNGKSGEITDHEVFRDKHWLDRWVGIGIALHEGQLFGVANQLLALLTTSGLVFLSLSGLILWWRRREPGAFSPPRKDLNTSIPRSLIGLIGLLGIAMPLFGVSVVAVYIFDAIVLSRIRRVG